MHELDSWGEEMRSAFLYRVVAQAEAGTPRQGLFQELAHEAEKQAAIWARDNGYATQEGLAQRLVIARKPG